MRIGWFGSDEKCVSGLGIRKRGGSRKAPPSWLSTVCRRITAGLVGCFHIPGIILFLYI
jgi:hypothetical protein